MSDAPPAVLLTGATGFLGGYIVAELQRRGVAFATAGRGDVDVVMDLAAPATVAGGVTAARAPVVLNCGAVSTMGACERDPAVARRVNTEAVGALAATGVRLVQVSTDLVFDGASAPYAAAAEPAPCSEYGRTKADAEQVVLAAGGVVARLPLLFGRSRDAQRGATDMVRRAGGCELGLFSNEHRTPLHAADAARALVDLAADAERRGVVHLAGPERLSRYRFAVRFARIAGLPTEQLRRVECNDPLRPRDVSLAGEWDCGRSLDEALAAS